MLSRRLLQCLALASLLAIWICPPAAQADRPPPPCDGVVSDATNPSLVDTLGAWWREHGQPVLGQERRLANGVSWRLLIDQPTGIAEPRITWMPDASELRRANRLFDAVHTCIARVEGNHPLAWQVSGSATLTYASSRLVSSIEVVAALLEERDKELPAPEGHIFDLARGEDLGPEPCAHSSDLLTLDRPFRVGDLLDTCATGAHDRFLALWRRGLEETMRLPSYRRDTGTAERHCPVDFDTSALPDLLFGVHLTPAGLAVRIVRMWPRGARYACTRTNSPYDTVVIPWRDMEPFLKPGPWRDELLKQ